MKAASALAISVSGMHAAMRRIEAASHNVANLLTEGFRPVRTHAIAQSVDLAGELVGMQVARFQFDASLRVADTQADLLGTLLDLHA